MSIASNIAAVRAHIPTHVRLVCVSKFHPAEAIQAAYNSGERCFGESHAQELVQKQAQLPADIEWHFIGSLQTNKAKLVVPIAKLIHSVDSERLLATIDHCAAKNNLISNVLLEIHIAKETTKHGFSPDEIRHFFDEKRWETYPNVRICGLMTMGTANVSPDATRAEFRSAKCLFDTIKAQFAQPYFTELSIGMSDDYPIAISEGSTIVRIGTAIFGER